MRIKNNKGFTLIELLVVIAIIGVLASIVLASLNSARRKSRDARRIADTKQLQLALELYFDSQNSYPAGTTFGTLATTGCGGSPCIPQVPGDPLGGGAVYRYQGATLSGATYTTCGTAPCTYYHLGGNLEEDGTGGAGTGGNQALANDRDLNVTGSNVQGLSADCATAGANDGCYDVTP